MTMDIHEILKRLPHRYPFLLVDRVLEIERGQSLKALKNVTMNEHFFVGHFPHRPVMPGVMILEALAQAAAKNNPKLQAFIEECKKIGTAQAEIDTAEKLGFDTGIRAVHPFDPAWQLPVYVANFILMEYGTGAIFGCPAHDQRDLDFVNKYGLGHIPVVCPEGQYTKTCSINDHA